MLSQKDKIFTNLYGEEPPSLAAAKKRGDWKNTKKFLEKGPDWLITQVKESGLIIIVNTTPKIAPQK